MRARFLFRFCFWSSTLVTRGVTAEILIDRPASSAVAGSVIEVQQFSVVNRLIMVKCCEIITCYLIRDGGRAPKHDERVCCYQAKMWLWFGVFLTAS